METPWNSCHTYISVCLGLVKTYCMQWREKETQFAPDNMQTMINKQVLYHFINWAVLTVSYQEGIHQNLNG